VIKAITGSNLHGSLGTNVREMVKRMYSRFLCARRWLADISMLATYVAASTFRDRTVFIEDPGFRIVSSTRMFGVSTSFGAKIPDGLCYIPREVSL
jgi:hypothetical protein